MDSPEPEPEPETGRDETSLAASFFTAALHVIIFAAMTAVFQSLGIDVPSLGGAGYVALLFIAVLAAAAAYYLTTGALGGTILYSLMVTVLLVMLMGVFSGVLTIPASAIPVTTSLLFITGIVSSMLGLKMSAMGRLGRITSAALAGRRALR
jgi:hypothetical protein